jgi:hypothetical protein
VLKTAPQLPQPAVALFGRWTLAVRVLAWWRWPAALLLAWLTCPVPQLAPAQGTDNSWQAGLALAQQAGLHFGRDIVFTYGPLGFLTVTRLFVVWTGIAAVIFALVLQVLLCRTLLHVMRDLPALIAVVVTYVVGSVAPGQAEIGLMIVFALTLSLLADQGTRLPRWLPVAGGIAASTLLLIKPNTGVFAIALAVIAVGFCAPRPVRALVELGGSFVVGFALLWWATGNAIGDVVPWFRASVQFAVGYTGGMAFIDPGRHREVRDAVLLIVVSAALVWRAGEGQQRARRAALALAWAIGTFAILKEGFVRLDAHAGIFFFGAAVTCATLARRELTRVSGVGAAIVASLWALTAVGVEPSALFHYMARAHGTTADVRLLADGHARNLLRADARAAMFANLRMPSGVLRDLRSHTVDVEPMETSAVWTLGLHWRPQPDFQSYAVLTPALDRMNADLLVSPRRPDRVMRVYPLSAADGRNAVFDAPNAFLALVCNYRETFANGALEVLAHAANRCGPPRRLGGSLIQAGQHVRVPRRGPNDLIYARLQIPRPFSERLRELIWKPAVLPGIVLDGVPFRLVAATASGPLLMRMPASAGFPTSGLADAQVDVFRLSDVPSPVRVDFYAVRVG